MIEIGYNLLHELVEKLQQSEVLQMLYANHNNSCPYPASILYKSTVGRYRSVSYPDGPITARYRFIKKNAYWVSACVEAVKRHPYFVTGLISCHDDLRLLCSYV